MQKKFIILITVILFAGLLVFAGAKGYLDSAFSITQNLTSPLELLVSNSSGQMSGFLSGIFQLEKIQSDNAGLRDSVNKLEAQVAQLSADKKENDRLRALLGFTTVHSFSYVPASVIAYDPSNIRGNLTIDKGSDSGLKTGMAVISDGFLIGRISKIESDSAQIRLITDPDSSIAAVLQNSNASGIAIGQIGYGLNMQKIPQGSAVNAGDMVMTSGLGGDLPKGLIIGKVQSVQKPNNSLFISADIQASADLTNLTRLIVIKG